jgi:hypothetical protein
MLHWPLPVDTLRAMLYAVIHEHCDAFQHEFPVPEFNDTLQAAITGLKEICLLGQRIKPRTRLTTHVNSPACNASRAFIMTLPNLST